MKLAIVEGFKAFLKQARTNRVELAKKVCEKNGYSVEPTKTETVKKAKAA